MHITNMTDSIVCKGLLYCHDCQPHLCTQLDNVNANCVVPCQSMLLVDFLCSHNLTSNINKIMHGSSDWQHMCVAPRHKQQQYVVGS